MSPANARINRSHSRTSGALLVSAVNNTLLAKLDQS
jgi:hypothetical protein